MIFLKNVDPFENVTYGSESVYELEYSVSSGNVSEPIYIPDVGKPVSMSLFPGSGASGYIECTNDIYSRIAAGMRTHRFYLQYRQFKTSSMFCGNTKHSRERVKTETVTNFTVLSHN